MSKKRRPVTLTRLPNGRLVAVGAAINEPPAPIDTRVYAANSQPPAQPAEADVAEIVTAIGLQPETFSTFESLKAARPAIIDALKKQELRVDGDDVRNLLLSKPALYSDFARQVDRRRSDRFGFGVERDSMQVRAMKQLWASTARHYILLAETNFKSDRLTAAIRRASFVLQFDSKPHR